MEGAKVPNKEEILKKHIQCNCGEIYLSRNLKAPDCPYHAYDWESAMDEYATAHTSAAMEGLIQWMEGKYNNGSVTCKGDEYANCVYKMCIAKAKELQGDKNKENDKQD